MTDSFNNTLDQNMDTEILLCKKARRLEQPGSLTSQSERCLAAMSTLGAEPC